MLLTQEQIELLKGDLDYILGRTACDTIPLTKGQVANAIARDPDALLDLVRGLSSADARWLSVSSDALDPLIERRLRGATGGRGADAVMPLALA